MNKRMSDIQSRASAVAARLSDCRGIVESSDLPDALCKIVTDCIAESAFFNTEFESVFSEVTTANARERPTFIAGANAVMNDQDVDIEQAWQQYRCQDDTDWKVVSEEEEAITAAALETVGAGNQT